MFLKAQLPFLTYVNCEGPYLVKVFLYNFYLFFDSAFAQLGVITRTSNKFVEIVVVAERYLIQGITCIDIIPCLITAHVKNKKLKKQPLRIAFPQN